MKKVFLLYSTLATIMFIFNMIYGQHQPVTDNMHIQHVFIYSHGLNSAGSKAKSYIKREVIPPQTHYFNYEDAQHYVEVVSGVPTALTWYKSSIGQAKDIAMLRKYIANYSDKSIVLFGESRGASTILNYLGEKPHNSAIKAAILDSPFDTVRNVLQHKLKRMHLLGVCPINQVSTLFTQIYPEYKPHGIQPIKSAHTIANDIPLLFICTKEDDLVPYTASLELYKIIAARNNKTHLLVMQHGKHAWIHEGKQAERYRNVIHAFYKKYHIEHVAAFAQQGKTFFEQNCQPTVEEISIMLQNIPKQ